MMLGDPLSPMQHSVSSCLRMFNKYDYLVYLSITNTPFFFCNENKKSKHLSDDLEFYFTVFDCWFCTLPDSLSMATLIKPIAMMIEFR